MTQTLTTSSIALTQVVSNIASKFSATVSSFFVSIANSQSREGQIRALNSLSDTELGLRYGIKRDQIINYVFRDKMMY